MELVITFVSALLALSAAFFLLIGLYDILPLGSLSFGHARRRATLDTLAGAHYPLIPRTIRQTPLD